MTIPIFNNSYTGRTIKICCLILGLQSMRIICQVSCWVSLITPQLPDTSNLPDLMPDKNAVRKLKISIRDDQILEEFISWTSVNIDTDHGFTMILKLQVCIYKHIIKHKMLRSNRKQVSSIKYFAFQRTKLYFSRIFCTE